MTTTYVDPHQPLDYPARLTVARDERQRRLTNFPVFIGTLIRLVLLVPHFMMLYGLYIAQGAAFLLILFGILFTGRYPRGLFKLMVGVTRWEANVLAYYLHLFDEYPALDLEQRPDRALQLVVDYPEEPSRWLNFPFFGQVIKSFCSSRTWPY